MVVEQFQTRSNGMFYNCSGASLKNFSRTVPEKGSIQSSSRTNYFNISEIALKPEWSVILKIFHPGAPRLIPVAMVMTMIRIVIEESTLSLALVDHPGRMVP